MARSIDDINPFGPTGGNVGNLSAGQEFDPFNPSQGFFGNTGGGGGGSVGVGVAIGDLGLGGGVGAGIDIGGGTTIPPDNTTIPNFPIRVFVPPTYAEPNYGTLKINLIAEESTEFFENDVPVGIGVTTTLSYNPSLKFGTSRIYKSNTNNKISKNYYEVRISKRNYRPLSTIDDISPIPIERRGLTFTTEPFENYPFGQPTMLDVMYSERISIREYVYNEITKEYEAAELSNINSVNGVVNLNFSFIPKESTGGGGNGDIDPPPLGLSIAYNVDFISNYTNELGEFIKLNYQIVSKTNDIVDSGDCDLSVGNIDQKFTDEKLLTEGTVNLNVFESYITARLALNAQNLPEGFTYADIYWAPKEVYQRTKDNVFKLDGTVIQDFTGWNRVGKSFKVSGAEFLSGIVVGIMFNKQQPIEITKYKPVVTLTDFIKEFEVKDSDDDKIVKIPFTTTRAEYVDVYISDSPIRVPAQNGIVELSFKNDFVGIYGSKIIYFVPWNEFGRGETVSDIVRFIPVNDFPSITQITLPETIDVPAFSDLNIEFDIEYNTFSATSVDVYVLDINKQKVALLSNVQPNGSFTVNLRNLITNFLSGNQIDLTFVFVPYNRAGIKELIGNEYELTTLVTYPVLNLDESQIKTSIFQIIVENLKFNDLAAESKYLTHLVNFGNNEQIIISSWEEDDWTLSEKQEDELGNLVVTNKVDSILLKLYSPLPANISTNSTLWITKLMSNPLIETIVLTEQSDINCPPIKGPNFNIDVDFVSGKSTAFESLDNLILDTPSSNNLVSTYLSASLINTDELNIEYYSGPNFLTGSIQWSNFVHFSSAKERVDNFVYKVQLIETYELAISASNASQIHSGSIGSKQESERQTLKKNQLINNFDGFEKFLYTPSYATGALYTTSSAQSITWPHSGSVRLLSTDTASVQPWYENLIELAESYDSENQNYLKNNIPQYILNNNENDNFLLFFSMIGHHFDNIYYFTKAIEKNRGLGYKNRGGMPDKLLFDTLKSFGWDAKNLAVDEKLWKYVYGEDSLGNIVETNPAKKRTYEVWRRIINNLPYLLKHKGTRRGVYALMACYGIPSSNLSILEFGGPEPEKRFNSVEETGTTKLLMDNTTYALSMNNGSKIELEWKTTDKGDKPKTIELFLKPAYAGQFTIVSGSGNWNVEISGSTDSQFGVVKFNNGGSTILSSSVLPIFNNRFFGLAISSGSYGIKLDLKQVEKDRSIFESYSTASVSNNFTTGNKVWIGGNYTGSIDEVRLWSTALSSSAFYKHVFFPEAINGNHISSSTDDLFFRLDFEYPKNLYGTSGISSLINVDTNIYFSSSVTRNEFEEGLISITPGVTIFSENVSASYSASASGFSSIVNYPYNFEPIERTISLEIPNIGSNRYSTNKVRFESQTDVFGNDVTNGINLSAKSRATKKAFDNLPADSNRIGLLFSPTKELNIDIAKSFGGINLDDYIGDPSDEYRSTYKSLDRLREYYFSRYDGRDIYDYINLIKSYEKSLFDDIKKILPARARVTTGLLVEPHILERSKIEQSKPTGSNYQQESIIDTREHTILIGENSQYESIVDANLSENLNGQNNQYNALINSASVQKTIAENYQYSSLIEADDSILSNAEYYQKDTLINVGLGEPTILSEIDVYDINTIAGQSEYETVGFGVYGQNGHAIRTYYDKDGNLKKERVIISLVKERKTRDIVKYKVNINGKGDPRGGLIATSSVYFESKLNIQPYTGSTGLPNDLPSVGGKVVSVTPLNGYLPTHYRSTTDLTRGLKNSYYLGSKNTAATTLDGTPPVETFATNPNTLRVNKAGRDASEPILEVE